MSSPTRSRLLSLALAVACTAAGPAALAETRRALLVGIGQYPPGAGRGARGDWPSLDGAVNDAQAMREVLVARYGFRREHVVLLVDGEATREAILSAFRRVLIEPVRPGDVGVFFFAGHGSWMRNSLSREPDERDETLVAADARDIRDKELARLMGEAADRKLRLTAFFDSCHSGSISRGLALPRKARAVGPDPTADARDPNAVPTPTQKGFLVVSAAQDFQSAVEVLDDDGRPHGAFTAALLGVLRSAPIGADAESILLRVHALLHAGAIAQDPLLDGPEERRRSPLFDSAGGAARRGTAVAAGSVGGGAVEIMAGFALGLAPGALLVRASDQGRPRVRLRVEEVKGVARSLARAASDADAAVPVSPGDLFIVERWAASAQSSLRVFLDPPAEAAEVRAAARALLPLRRWPGLRWVEDPSVLPPTHVLLRGERGWKLRGPTGEEEIGGALSAAAVARRLARRRDAPSLFVRLPAPKDLAARMGAAQVEGLPISRAASERDALYVLAGRVGASGEPEYAWVLATSPASRDLSSPPLTPLPRRSAWQAGALADPALVAEGLVDSALRVVRVRAWLTLAAPPQEVDEFPYRLAFRRWGARELLPPGETMHASATYEPVLAASPVALARGSAVRYVYVLVLDTSGHIGVLYPSDRVSVNNRFPVAEPGKPLPAEIALGEGGRFRILPPFGVDTYMLLATEEPLASLPMLEQSAVLRGGGREGQDALGALLESLGGTRGNGAPIPGAWSIERVTATSAP